ncbi:MAG: fibronectin type III domain-containing protein [Gelidibacter sp.]|nr:fibronectin type III domain-containing protein [Gelidibacter sp.]
MKKISLLVLISLLIFSCNKDDEMVQQCIAPTNLTETNITYHSATIQWEDANEAQSFRILYGVSGFPMGSGNTFTVTGNTATINGLLPNTTYDYYVDSYCDANNISLFSTVKSFTTLSSPVSTEFQPTLSEMNLFAGTLNQLQPSAYAFEYQLHTPLFTDYAHKQRLIALPAGQTLEVNGDGFPNFPDNTVIAKTFYYNIDDRDESLGKTIVETRVLIKKSGIWQLGNYKWNTAQTEAYLDTDGGTVPLVWIDTDGNENSVNYNIPNSQDCIKCHNNTGIITPIGPKLRSLNFEVNGINQLQKLKDFNLLNGLSSPDDISILPNWEDTNNYTLAERARAYLDVNCAHCHSPGGFCSDQMPLDFRYETPFEDTNIDAFKYAISGYTSFYSPGVSMPLIGTTMVHQEGHDLIQAYVNSL